MAAKEVSIAQAERLLAHLPKEKREAAIACLKQGFPPLVKAAKEVSHV